MSQTKMLKDDILSILSKSVSGGSAASDAEKSKIPVVYESSETPEVFFGGADDPKCKNDSHEVVKFCAKPKQKSTRPTSAWVLHLKKYMKDNKVSYKDAMKLAKPSYKSDAKPAKSAETPKQKPKKK